LSAENLAECYAALDLTPGATEEDVRNAYVDLVKVWHPDRYESESPRLRKRAEEKIKALNQAYERIRSATVTATANGSASIASLSVLLYPKSFGDKWGYVNAADSLAISPRFEFAGPFSENLARAREGGRWGFIDLHGAWVVAPEFLAARDFSEGLAGVVFREKWGFIDKAGRYAVNALYEECARFSEGLAAVLWHGRWGFIDREGKFVLNPRYQEARPFRNGWADVRIGARWGRVNRVGDVFFADTAEIG
jgi:hypothetical protein